MEKETVKKILHDILTRMGVDFAINIVEDNDLDTVIYTISTDDSNLLIGYKGTNLFALSHVVRRIVDNKGDCSAMKFLIDVNDYHKNKIEEIKTSAKMLAERARYFKSSVEMNPLPARDRMIVHALFTNSREFETKSHGEGDNRRVVITYTGER